MLSNGHRTRRRSWRRLPFREFPNPERIGCPDPETWTPSPGEQTDDQEQLHHVTHCSPCFQTFLSIREETPARGERSGFRVAIAACAAAIVVGDNHL